MKASSLYSSLAAICMCANIQAQFPVVGTTTPGLYQITSLGSGIRFITAFQYGSGAAQRTIYELDLSVHRVLNIPAPPAGTTWSMMGYITEELFDNDPSTIEFLMSAGTFWEGFSVHVFREDGTELYSADPGQVILQVGAFYAHSEPVFAVDGQTYMAVHGTGVDSVQWVLYALPGSLPCMDCYGSPHPSSLNVGGVAIADPNSGMHLYPNPAQQSAVLDMGKTSVDAILLWDASGRKVREERPTSGGLHTIELSGLAAGNYTVECRHQGIRIAALPLVVQR